VQKIRVLIVDDHTIVRDGICALLGLTPDIEVIGEAANGKEALDMLREVTPDVVLMDIALLPKRLRLQNLLLVFVLFTTEIPFCPRLWPSFWLKAINKEPA